MPDLVMSSLRFPPLPACSPGSLKISVGNVNWLTCMWCLSSATWASYGRSCNWPHLGRRSEAFSWFPRFWHRFLRFLAERRTFAFSSACPWAPWGCICLVGIHKTYSDSAKGETPTMNKGNVNHPPNQSINHPPNQSPKQPTIQYLCHLLAGRR